MRRLLFALAVLAAGCGSSGEPNETKGIVVELQDGTTVQCVDSGQWGTCDFVGYSR